MNQQWLLIGLLVLSYVASMLATGRTIRGFGLPSGSEYLLLGFVLGPVALGFVGSSLLETFAPLLVVGAAWIALVAGVGYGVVGGRKVQPARAVVGVVIALLLCTSVASSVWYLLQFLGVFGTEERRIVAIGAGAIGSETTRHAVRWVVERHGARGTLSDALADYARAGVLAPALLLSALFSANPVPGLSELPWAARAALAVGVGVVLGLVALLLLGRDFRRDESWGVLLGTSLLGVGIATRLELSAISTNFFLGLTLAIFSPHSAEVKAMVGPTEKPVVLPVAVLAGASLKAFPFALELLSVFVLARVVGAFAVGSALGVFVPAARAAGRGLGFSLVSSGAFTLACAVSLQQRFPGEVGQVLLAVGAVALLSGELLGPLMLRRALTLSGDIPLNTPAPPDATSEHQERADLQQDKHP